ncbi:MAG: c-type cytochrome [Pseudomonadota bacterium]|nr:c-type cytochrome [Pseudomonadota bacterium]
MKQTLTTLLAFAAALCALLTSATAAHAQDAARGAEKANMCIGCHGIPGYKASFPVVYRVPVLSGQNVDYIIAALNEYKKGARDFPTMRAIAASLSDTDMADLAAFYNQQVPSSAKPAPAVPPAPNETVAALLTKGACASCHGANFSKPITPAYPKLAGQHNDYLAMALRSYATVGNPNLGRSNAIMGAQVKQFKPDELKAIADYLGSLPTELHEVSQSYFVSH